MSPDKVAPGAWREGPADPEQDAKEGTIRRLKERRDNARWGLVVGVGMMFVGLAASGLGGLAIAVAVGGASMTLWGGAAWAWWGWRLHKVDDPWAYDPDLDGPPPGGEGFLKP